MVKAIGDNIAMSEYNGLVYLLRKFKKIVRHEKINKVLETDVGTLNVTSGFINVGENFILENDVNIISKNCLPLTTYYFTFYIINADTSETILETPVTLSGDTDKYGNLEITIPENLLSTGEEIRREIKIEITFQDHEGISPSRLLNLNLTTDKKYISNGETATVTATLLDTNDEPLTGYTVYFDVNGVEISRITNSDGEAVLTFTGTGDTGVLNIKVLDKEINIIDYYFYDSATSTDHNDNYWRSYWEIDYRPQSTMLMLCNRGANNFCPSTVPTQLDITKRLEFDTPYSMEFDIYQPNDNVHLRVWDGNTSPYTIYFDYPINKIGHYKLIVNEDVIQLWINNTLIEEQIEVTDDTSVSFVSIKTSTAECKYLNFANLIIYNYETYEPPAHDYSLSVTGTSIIESGDIDTITATLTDNGVSVAGATLSYQIKHGSTTIDTGTSTTDSNGQISISYTGTGVGDVDVIVSFGAVVQETYMIEDLFYYDSLTEDKGRYTTISGSPVLTYSSNGLNINTSVKQVGLVRNNALTLPNDYEAEITITNAPAGQFCSGICFDDWLYDWASTSANGAFTYKLSNTQSFLHAQLQKPVTNDVVKIIKTGTTIKAYINDNLIVTDTISNDNHYQQFRTYQNRSTTFKNLKIKAL